MKKHFSLHLHSGHKILVKEINTCPTNSAALLLRWQTAQSRLPGSSGQEGCSCLQIGSFGLDTEGHGREWLLAPCP